MANKPQHQRIKKPVYYGNWGDIWGFPLAEKLLPVVTAIPFLTPNVITIIGFTSFILGSLLLFVTIPHHLYFSAFLLPFGFLMDDLDGQVARARNLSSEVGNYLDKVFDVIKIFAITASLSFAVYLQTHNVLYIYLGFIAASFFYLRYYVKLETVLRQVEKDKEYLAKSSKKMEEVENKMYQKHIKQMRKFPGVLGVMWDLNRTIFFVDEAEFAVITAFFALLNRLDIALWILAVSQVIIFIYRAVERGHQTTTKSERLYYFMRK